LSDPRAPVIISAAEVPYTRHPDPTLTTTSVLADACRRALDAAGLEPRDVDGFAVASFSLRPDNAIDLVWRMGLTVEWLLQDTNGGASGVNMLGHAVNAIRNDEVSTVLIVSGDAMDPVASTELSRSYNRVTRDVLWPIGYRGPNALFAMLTQRQMAATGMTRADYGALVTTQRQWATRNPNATYQSPMTIDEYLNAPEVASPLHRFDCVPRVSGANAVVVTAASNAPGGSTPIAVKAVRRIANADGQRGDGLSTGLERIAPKLWNDAGIDPGDVSAAFVYDDYPAMVLAQLSNLGIVDDARLPAFVHDHLATEQFPVNTSGGMLSCGQAGSAGGLHGMVEAVTQLQGNAGDRQIDAGSNVVVTGYGMVVHRFGAVAGAAVLGAE